MNHFAEEGSWIFQRCTLAQQNPSDANFLVASLFDELVTSEEAWHEGLRGDGQWIMAPGLPEGVHW